jgi:hypothetical protein
MEVLHMQLKLRPIALSALSAAALSACLYGAYTTANADVTIEGPTHSRFGFAVISNFDLDKDLSHDIAISAPVPGVDKVYLYGRKDLDAPAQLTEADALGVFTGEKNGEAGWALAAGNLVNESFYADLVITAPSESGGRGRIYILSGGTLEGELGPEDATTIITGVDPGDYAGWSVAIGDFNGDWTNDLLIGACGGSGRAYVVHGPIPAGEISLNDADVTVKGAAMFGNLGCAVAATDLNGDHRDEIVVGEYAVAAEEGRPAGSGKVHIIWSVADGNYAIGDVADRTELIGENPLDNLGFSLSGGGDLNGDGLEDLAIGAPGQYCHLYTDYPAVAGGGPCAFSSFGHAYVLLGAKDSGGQHVLPDSAYIDEVASVTINGDTPEGELGRVVAMVGDVNDDGDGDLFVGTHIDHSYVFYGSQWMGTPSYSIVGVDTASVTIDGTADGRFSGTAATGIRDIDGDGNDDLLIGASGQEWYEDGPQNRSGMAHLFFAND